MSTFSERLDAAAGAATCQFLNQFGSAAVGYGAYALFAGGTGTVPMALGAAALLASNAACTWDPDGTPTVDDYGPVGNLCWKTDGSFNVESYENGVLWATPIQGATEITNSTRDGDVSGAPRYRVDFKTTDGSTAWAHLIIGTTSGGATWTINQVQVSGTCTADGPGSTSQPTPYTYTDPDTSCELTVHWEGVVTDGSGTPQPVYRIEPATTGVRAGGGIIQGCNFAPVLYVGGGGGGQEPPFTIPVPDNPLPGPDGQPWWMPLVEAALGGIIGAAAKKILDELTEESVAGRVYRLTSVCETNDQGEPISQSREVVIPDLSLLQGAIYRLDAIEYLLQGLKDFKQPICRPSKGQGDLVTVHFESDEPSIAGERPLRKTLNYRDQMASDLAAHAAHWENFAWEAGDVIVYHEGAAWGKLTVWANSADEGKRVIRHAGTISGVNPDAEGEWAVTHSSSARYGRTGTMRLAKRKSAQGMVLRISKRGGPDGLPIVPVDPAP